MENFDEKIGPDIFRVRHWMRERRSETFERIVDDHRRIAVLVMRLRSGRPVQAAIVGDIFRDESGLWILKTAQRSHPLFSAQTLGQETKCRANFERVAPRPDAPGLAGLIDVANFARIGGRLVMTQKSGDFPAHVFSKPAQISGKRSGGKSHAF